MSFKLEFEISIKKGNKLFTLINFGEGFSNLKGILCSHHTAVALPVFMALARRV